MGRLVARQHRLVLGDLGLDVAIIEGEEQVAGLDELPDRLRSRRHDCIKLAQVCNGGRHTSSVA